MKTLRLGLAVAIAGMGIGVGTVWGRQIPETSPTISDTREWSGFEYGRESLSAAGGGIQRDGEAIDPVVLEPIRPVFPGDSLADGFDMYPSVCGRMNTGVPTAMLAGLVIFRVGGLSGRRKA